MNIALYFGSFNPIHKGHIAICEYIASLMEYEQVWLVISPQNPLKSDAELTNEQSRIEMAELAFQDSEFRDMIKISNIEFELEKPSYTINTLHCLKDKYPKHRFAIVMGEDNLTVFEKWKNWDQIIENHTLLIYPRQGCNKAKLAQHHNVCYMTDAPLYPIDSTSIRRKIKSESEIEDATPTKVVEYIKNNNLYE